MNYIQSAPRSRRLHISVDLEHIEIIYIVYAIQGYVTTYAETLEMTARFKTNNT